MTSMDHSTATLTHMQDGVLEHFNSLAAARKRSGFPIFALEHGMSATELDRVKALLHEQKKASRTLMPYWLLWTVYASESGYGYTGDEYWPSFERQTPNWEYHDRPKVKRWFERFQRSFNGVVPSGPWARNFSIIAWPITHALLPRYLQRQFARLLYELRFSLASAGVDPGSIGRLLGAHVQHTSTRFQAFLEQEELTGQIVVALLHGDSVGADDLIHPGTLSRIVEDLERVRSSREWLRETRRVVSDRFKGIGRGTYRTIYPTTGESSDEPVLRDPSRFVIRPDLFLRYTGSGKWSVLLHLKSLRPIAAESTTLRLFLNRTRCRLNGASDWKPTGWLLSGNRMGALKRWPNANVPLIQFEQPNPLMNHLLESECRLTPSRIWLFHIGSDGIARHIASANLRPANDYILVTTGSIPADLPGSALCPLECEGVRALRVEVPDQVRPEVTSRFRELGLDVARTIRVWPAGLPGRGWDGEGSSEWLTTESPCFGIAPDHPLKAVSFRLNSEPEQILSTAPPGESTFVRLPPLPAGIHTLNVEARRSPDLDDTVSTPPAKGFVRLSVREPEPWVPGVASHPGLIVTTDPYDPCLADLWRNELKASVNGPEGFSVSLAVELHTADGHRILSERVGGSMALPITPHEWCSAFAHFLDNEDRSWKYLEAASCTIEINGDSLGRCQLRLDHDPSPLRWTFRRRRGGIFARIVDDTGQHDTTPDLRFYSMDRPLSDTFLNPETLRKHWAVPPPGGLFHAQHARYEDTAVLSALSPRAGLQDVSINPSVDIPPGASGLTNAFGVLRLWYGARQAGFLASRRLDQVTNSIVSAIFRRMCGKRWVNGVEAFEKRPLSMWSLKVLDTLVDRRTNYGRRLSRLLTESGEDVQAVDARFAVESERQRISSDHDLCHFALRLATRPGDVLSDDLLNARIEQLVQNPALLRGAHLVSLLRAHGSNSTAGNSPRKKQT